MPLKVARMRYKLGVGLKDKASALMGLGGLFVLKSYHIFQMVSSVLFLYSPNKLYVLGEIGHGA